MKLIKENGWIEGIHHCPSPNCDCRPEGTDIELLVIHGISLPPGQYGGMAIEQLFTNRLDPNKHNYFKQIHDLRVSAHFLIKRDGEIIQFVALTDRAWHAGVSEYKGRKCCNDFSIGIELEGCDDEPYEEAQYQSLAQLTKLIQDRWPAIKDENIVGHCHIAEGRKTDPGAAFEWEKYRYILCS